MAGFVICFLQLNILSAQVYSPARDTDRDVWQKPELIMDSIGVKSGMIIGEVGAGEGYFTVRLARRIGESGIVYANDIREYKILEIKWSAEAEGLNNIKTILGEVEDPLFPDGTLELVVMLYVFHDLTRPVELMRNIIPDLKPGAGVYINR